MYSRKMGRRAVSRVRKSGRKMVSSHRRSLREAEELIDIEELRGTGDFYGALGACLDVVEIYPDDVYHAFIYNDLSGLDRGQENILWDLLGTKGFDYEDVLDFILSWVGERNAAYALCDLLEDYLVDADDETRAKFVIPE